MAKVSPVQFLQQVRDETKKVVWPTRRETIVTAIMVLVITIIMSIFFLLVDTGIFQILRLIIG